MIRITGIFRELLISYKMLQVSAGAADRYDDDFLSCSRNNHWITSSKEDYFYSQYLVNTILQYIYLKKRRII